MSQIVNVNQNQTEILVWQKDTWGSFGQHHNIYTFVIDVEKKQQVPVFQLVTVRHVKKDSRKNIHRFTYVSQSELKKLAGKILKIVEDYKSSGKHVITVKYKIVTESGDLTDLEYETGLRDNKGWYDLVYLPSGRKLIIRKEEVEVQ